MKWGKLLQGLGNGALESAALHAQGIGVAPRKGRRAKRGTKGAEESSCTPCKAMANVDAHRKRLGYSIT